MNLTIPEQDQSADAVRFVGRSFLIHAEAGHLPEPQVEPPLPEAFDEQDAIVEVYCTSGVGHSKDSLTSEPDHPTWVTCGVCALHFFADDDVPPVVVI